ncbi:invasion associated locus B family protein [Rhabdaerophilum sp. SD176]|uniref:invasion associated locus B family protein n=1 Tax=Rhabdaerophilum sp. SD176 TaxID=2983548 RepID=UPI0024E00927|nr:invasion associated locus B family protein [Rhabdaerophilum sp. SD176]
MMVSMSNMARSASLAAMALAGLASLPASAQAPRPAQPAPAQPAAPAAPAAPPAVKVPLKAAPDQADWLKVCGLDPSVNKTICYTTRDFVAENNQPVMAVAVYSIKEEPRRFVRILVPLTFLIQPGIRFSAEGTQPVNARFQICLPQGCFVEGELNEATITGLKKATTLRIDMQNQIGQEVNFEVPLAGFAKAYDSAGIDQETLQRMQQQGAQPQQAPAGGNADDLKRRGEELLRQRQQAPKQ